MTADTDLFSHRTRTNVRPTPSTPTAPATPVPARPVEMASGLFR